ncbi:MAG: hypothetical protein HYT69_01260 [Candidatus Zambryskibacteria bacterium]|nr:hypothetical protein [Candidatus Zambryskibacteria bacterium]
MKKVFILTFYFLILTPAIAFAQSVDILWQGEGYTPPFYYGRTLWSSQSRITLVAVPQGLGNSTALNYKWSRNGTVLGSISGVGKNTLSFVDSVLSKSQAIKIEIVSSEGDTLAQSSTVITPVSPSLLVYENSPLYGFMFHREVGGNYILREPEVTFDTFPLFFSASDIAYQWGTNSGKSSTESSATYRAPEEGSGEAFISIEVKSANKILQSAKKSFLVKFGNDEPN